MFVPYIFAFFLYRNMSEHNKTMQPSATTHSHKRAKIDEGENANRQQLSAYPVIRSESLTKTWGKLVGNSLVIYRMLHFWCKTNTSQQIVFHWLCAVPFSKPCSMDQPKFVKNLCWSTIAVRIHMKMFYCGFIQMKSTLTWPTQLRLC